MKYTGCPARIATPTCESYLNPPMPGPWPARGSTTTKGRLVGSVARFFLGQNPEQIIVDRMLTLRAFREQLVIKIQNGRFALALVLDKAISAPSHGVPEQDPTLAGVGDVFECLLGTGEDAGSARGRRLDAHGSRTPLKRYPLVAHQLLRCNIKAHANCCTATKRGTLIGVHPTKLKLACLRPAREQSVCRESTRPGLWRPNPV